MHAWVLSKLFASLPTGDFVHQRYVIASCLLKIQSRLTHEFLSKPFIESLKKADMQTVEIKQVPKASGKLASGEAAADERFLCKVVVHCTQMNSIVKTPLPNLHKQSVAAIAGKPFEVYTNDTCSEFHALLLELLHLFEVNLAKLVTCRSAIHQGEPMPASFESSLGNVVAIGDALECIARGSAIEAHFRTIESSLVDHRRHSVVQQGTKASNEGETGLEPDTLHVQVQPYAIGEGGQVAPLWMSYRDWLRLMVAHVEAVTIVSGHVGRRLPDVTKSVSIQILAPPCSGGTMLTWTALLRSEHFPASGYTDTHSTEDIIAFLERYSKPTKPVNITAESITQTIATIIDLNNATELANTIALIGKQLQTLPGCQSPNSARHIEGIIAKLNVVRPQESSEQSSVELSKSQQSIREAIQMVKSLMDSSNLFRALRKGPLKTGKNFQGKQHCEASLAAAIIAATGATAEDDSNAFRDVLSKCQVRS
jgi:hypothetical protein